MNRHIQIAIIDWQGISVKVSYEPEWLNIGGQHRIAHLQLCSVSPERAALPVTETGYRSHFLTPKEVAAAGGPLAYARMWLDEAACGSAWTQHQEQARQLALF